MSALKAMSAAIAQRGPDGEGMWVDSRAGRVGALIHRRLAIIDLPGGSQPMANEDGRVRVVFNGEIYNHVELRRELERAGHRFATDHSDTEVLVHGWEEWGEELPGKLVGMFAFGVWDEGEETLFLARDRMGQKPLLYAALDDGIVFGSTIPSVLAWGEVPRRVPEQHVAMYLLMGYLPPPWTIYRDVVQVMPGHFVKLQRDVLTGGAYWKGKVGVRAWELEEASAAVREAVERAVASQLESDVPLACFLSGGIDSSIVAAVMQKAVRAAGGESIHTVSVGFREAGFDETGYAEQVAKQIGSRHTRLEVDAHQDVMGTLEGLVAGQLGQPFGDSSILPTYHLSRAVRALAPVALAGDGADEFFGGYDRYRAVGFLGRWGWLLRGMPLGMPGGGERWRRLVHAARGGSYTVGQYPRLLEIFPCDEVQRLFRMPILQRSEESEGEGVRYAMGLDQREYLPGDILHKVDAASMALALEVRAPFLDHRVVELARSFSEGMLIRGGKGKWILRQAFWDVLPREILVRGKKGFAVPMGAWFRGDLRGAVEGLLRASGSFSRQYFDGPMVERMLAEHQSRRRDHTHRLFTLLMLEVWWREAGAVLEE